ncbi:MAG: hypothetical protein HFJ54_08425 [Clostridia bacterium]|nr:hypothetical protein [Clostridia bacterium]
MRKILIYLLGIIGICFIIPIFFTQKFKEKEVYVEPEKVIVDIEKYTYTEFSKIKLLHKKTNEVEEVRFR